MLFNIQTVAMYLCCVAIWGTSYYTYNTFQAPYSSTELALLLRLGGALALFSLTTRQSRPLTLRDHACLAAFGLCNFTLAYWLLYMASERVASALVVIIFSCKSIFTPLLLSIFLRRPLQRHILIRGLIGIVRVALIVMPNTSAPVATASVVFTLLGTLLAAFGDVMSTRNHTAGITPNQANRWGVFYAMLGAAVLLSATQRTLTLPTVPTYWTSVLWLAFAASFVAWNFYLRLVKRIGPERTNTIVLLLPVGSVLVSITFEGYVLTPRAILGIALVVCGNSLALLKDAARMRAKASLPRDPCIEGAVSMTKL